MNGETLHGHCSAVADVHLEGDGAIDKAVRMVIFLIMLVFDPLAVLLLIAANISLKQRETESEPVENTPIIKGDEIVGFAKVFVGLGIKKIRLTGGEPLVRKDAGEIIVRAEAFHQIRNHLLGLKGIAFFHAEDIDRFGIELS